MKKAILLYFMFFFDITISCHFAGSSGRLFGGAVDLVQPDREAEGHQRAEETQSMF